MLYKANICQLQYRERDLTSAKKGKQNKGKERKAKKRKEGGRNKNKRGKQF
jgi:hypothetical protein